jgi:hypothetical protein
MKPPTQLDISEVFIGIAGDSVFKEPLWGQKDEIVIGV